MDKSIAERLHNSCTPWAYVNKPKFNVDPAGYDLKDVDNEFLNQFWNNQLVFVRSAMIARALSESYSDTGTMNIIWQQSINNAYSTAVIEWCKAYGTDNEEFHWKNVFGERTSFMRDLLDNAKISNDEYKTYWERMIRARNERIVHSHLDGEGPVELPEFDTAIKMARSVHFILNELMPHLSKEQAALCHITPMSFDTWRANLESTLVETIPQALEATKEIVAPR
ncbi:hypothetical protein [Marinobacter adhaerens]|uniref:hypothetical protein n=1 Tax=Marinobacter adhaerens TaxID=1033846 RepID=UPI003C5AD9CB